jgi:hypothetical protein
MEAPGERINRSKLEGHVEPGARLVSVGFFAEIKTLTTNGTSVPLSG